MLVGIVMLSEKRFYMLRLKILSSRNNLEIKFENVGCVAQSI